MKLFDKRIVRKFAFLPKVLDDGNEIWFSFYWEKQYFGANCWGAAEGYMKGHPRLSDNYWVPYYTQKNKL